MKVNRLVLVSLLLAATLRAAAQYPDLSAQRGLSPSGSYNVSNIETINPVNGNVFLRIPLASLPPGRAGWTAGINLTYNSSLYDATTSAADPSSPDALYNLKTSPTGGWQYEWKHSLNVDVLQGCVNSGKKIRFRLYTPDGGSHTLRLVSPQGFITDNFGDGYYNTDPSGQWYIDTNCAQHTITPPSALTYFTTDGTFITVSLSTGNSDWTQNTWTVFYPDGRTVTGTGEDTTSMSDQNGNTITFQNVTAAPYAGAEETAATTMTDDLGRAVTLFYYGLSAMNPNAPLGESTFDYITQPGPIGTVGSEVTWRSAAVGMQYQCSANGATCQPSETLLLVDGINNPLMQDNNGDNFTVNAAPPGSFTYYEGPSSWGQLKTVYLQSTATSTVATVTYNYMGYGNWPNWDPATISDAPLTSKTLAWSDENDSPPTLHTETWTYDYSSNSQTTVHNPDGGSVITQFGDRAGSPQVFKVVQPDGSSVERIWAANRPAYYTTFAATSINSYVQTEIRYQAGGSQANATNFKVDHNGNVIEADEYSFLPYSSVTHNSSGMPTGFSGGSIIRKTLNAYLSGSAPASDPNQQTNDSNGYWFHATFSSPINFLTQQIVQGSGASWDPGAVAEFTPDTHGNVAQERHWDSTLASGLITTCVTTNPCLTSSNATVAAKTITGQGNVTDVTTGSSSDSTLVATHFAYDANSLYPVSMVEAYGTSQARTTTYGRDFTSGVLNSTTDFNGLKTAIIYDTWSRPMTTTVSQSNVTKYLTTNSYDDTNRRVITSTDLNTPGDQALRSVTDYDQLGRVRLTRQLENSTQDATDNTQGIKVQTRYFNGSQGQYTITSNPFRSGTTAVPPSLATEPTMGWTMTILDQNGRTHWTETFPGPAKPVPGTSGGTGHVVTNYGGNTVTVTDQAGKVRDTTADALGRLGSVVEHAVTCSPSPCDYTTTYTYDALNNLYQVNQGAQSRTFTYSSLSRLLTAINPETEGPAVSYLYYRNGSLKEKDTPGGNSTAYGYDVFNRPASITYSGPLTAPAATYCYDGNTTGSCAGAPTGANLLGRLTMVTNSNSTTKYSSYDALGRVTASQQLLPGQSQPYSFGYSYNAAGELIAMSYPSGRTISLGYDGAGRISQVQKTAPGSVAPYYTVSSGAYAPHGPATSAQLGNGLWETTGFNDRLQGIDMKLGTSTGGAERWRLQNVFDSTQNNGNIKQQMIDIPGMSTITQAYQYDGVNRLLIAGENPGNVSSPACPDTASQWCRGFSYDQFGNRLIAQRTGQGASLQEPPGFDTSTNHVTGAGWTHDTYHRGTVTSDSVGNYTYDAENHMATANGMNFAYDGSGMRVMKGVPNGPTTLYVYDAFGALAAEYSVGVPVPTTGTLYLTQDQLGSTRVVTTSNGLPAERHDFLPFGEEILVSSGNPRSGVAGYSPSSSQTVLFTGVERDSNADGSPTGLDHFWARHLSTNAGRWTAPDPSLASMNLLFPQSFNRYAYVLNNPLAFKDPTGMECVWDDGKFDSADDPDTGSSTQCHDAGGVWIHPSVFAGLGLGDWSDTRNTALAAFSEYARDNGIWSFGPGGVNGSTAGTSGCTSSASLTGYERAMLVGSQYWASTLGKTIGLGLGASGSVNFMAGVPVPAANAGFGGGISNMLVTDKTGTSALVTTYTFNSLNFATGGGAVQAGLQVSGGSSILLPGWSGSLSGSASYGPGLGAAVGVDNSGTLTGNFGVGLGARASGGLSEMNLSYTQIICQ